MPVHIGIMGAGAIGCYYGALLAQGGHTVTLVGRQSFVDRVRETGLLLDIAGRTVTPAVDASADPADLAACDLLIFSVKSGDTEEAGRQIAPYVRRSTPILSFQNGVDNADRLRHILPGHDVIPVVVYVAAELLEPGHVKHNGRGEIVLGPSGRSDEIARLFSDAGVPATVSDKVREALWLKLTVNCAYNALSAIPHLPYGQLVTVDGVADVISDVIDECRSVGRWMGIHLSEKDVESVLSLARSMPDQYSSTAQDVARGKKSEIDHINGYVVQKGRELGIPTPVNRVLHVLVKLLEESSATKAGSAPTSTPPLEI
jgi:2-dehydropantoate 2-reductase